MYQERPSRVPSAVLWRRTPDDERTPAQRRAPRAVSRVLPDGCLDLIWTDGALLVAGPDTAAQVQFDVPDLACVGLRFAPGTGPEVFGVPGHILRDQRVPLARLWPTALVARLTEQVAASSRPGEVLESIAEDRLRHAGRPDPVTAELARRARAGLGGGVAGAASAVGLSERQLHRRSLHAFGYGLKTLDRILRLDRALRLARSGASFALASVDAGYADQAHLAREVKALAGVPLRELIGRST
jgi:AraC-like DNA-binding protein